MDARLRVAVNARVLEQGSWPLARITAAHLLDRLAAEHELHLDLIATEPIPEDLAAGSSTHVAAAPGGARAAAVFDQFHFPRAAARLGAQLVFYLHPSAPIAGSLPAASWFGDGELRRGPRGQDGRLARSLAGAGLRGAAAVLRSSDLAADPPGLAWVSVPPSVPSAFAAAGGPPAIPSSILLPDSFVLAVGETTATLPVLLAAWSWVEGSLGDTVSLLLISPDEEARRSAQRAADQRGLAESVRSITLEDAAWPAAFHRASALLHAGERQNAAALRWALASALPVAALATPFSQAIVGPAGYLVSPDARALGAACLTLLVEEEVAASLRQKGMERAESYRPEVAGPAWIEALRRAARPGSTTPARRFPSTRRD